VYLSRRTVTKSGNELIVTIPKGIAKFIVAVREGSSSDGSEAARVVDSGEGGHADGACLASNTGGLVEWELEDPCSAPGSEFLGPLEDLQLQSRHSSSEVQGQSNYEMTAEAGLRCCIQ
jgi:hypothetical protein